ncbi:GNAT family N-acetyltransferase [Herbiconiux moechotypicola]|uniref:ATP-grasp domain-containing protein n=1 Tax=Herbiconiux moechotypicola TaxID=637393 RepID=A0ABN3D7X1_9MICO|nr:GNAT family N-acetyltransferase [Herbiconiux moechotypicola]MCS5728350.1 GNAT family N-acetyltransferase [Herbiconiux moechotypicola]
MSDRAVVVTGGRAPVALDLARRFHEDGWRVVLADSAPMLGARSRAVHAAYRVPPPRHRPREFGAAVAGIARRHAAELVVPTCEEVFWLSSVAHDSGASGPAESLRELLVAPGPDALRRLHDKAEFLCLLDELGLAHPVTTVLSSPIAWRRLARRRGGEPAVVLKPAFSRFGTRIRFVEAGGPLPEPGSAGIGRVTPEERWLVQHRVEGEELCSYAVAVGGELTAFVVYRPVWRAGRGAGVAFERLDRTAPAARALRDASERLAGALGITGQFGLDAIDTPTGVSILECNPRATSGVHLFGPGDGLAEAFAVREVSARDARARSAVVATRRSARLGLPHLLCAPAGVRSGRDLVRFARQLAAPDALAEPGDRVPVAGLTRALLHQLATARREGVPVLAATTADLEWNGQTLSPGASASSREPEWGDVFATIAPVERAVENVRATVGVVTLSGERVPLVVSACERPAPGGGPQSYVVSPISHYVHYAREELGELRSPLARGAAGLVIDGLDRVLRGGRVDEVVLVGNALLSTNLLPDPAEGEVRALTARLVAEHPERAVVWRSVHGRGSGLPATLRRAGYALIPARSVLFTVTRESDWTTLRDVRRDSALLAGSGYRVIDAPLDAATGCSPPELRRRIAELYSLLYVDRYSRLNPRYTEEFVALAQRSGLLRFVLLERDGRVDGVLGYTVAHGHLAAPVVGYDTSLPQELGLYRMLSLLMLRTAADWGVDLHASSGVADFKRHRGAEQEFEYTAVYTAHLAWPRRLAWRLLAAVVHHIAVPLVRRAAL